MELVIQNMLTQENTFSELASWYLEVSAPQKLKDHTIFNYRLLLTDFVIPYLGDTKLSDISPVTVDNLLASLRENGSPKTGRVLKASTVNQIRMVLSAVFTIAVKKHIVNENPVVSSTPVRIDSTSRPFLDIRECRKIIELCDSLKNKQVGRAIKFLLLTGLRRGELVGLMWNDIDFRKREVKISRTVFRSAGKTYTGTPKSATSVRTVALGDKAIKILSEQKFCAEQLCAANRIEFSNLLPVFMNRKCGKMNGDYLNNTFRKMMKQSGLSGMHIHDLRHANASILINEGVPMKVVSEHLGHSSALVTEQFYIHLFPDSLRITAKVMDRVLK